MSTIHTILCPTDFSEHSDAAFQLACSFARDQGARLILLHVDPPPAMYGEVVDRRNDDDHYDRLWRELYHRKPPADSPIEVECRLCDGEPVEKILEVADDEDCDLIVLGMHGHSALGRLLMGSVGEKIVRTAACPVLTINRPFLGAKMTETGGKTVAARSN